MTITSPVAFRRLTESPGWGATATLALQESYKVAWDLASDPGSALDPDSALARELARELVPAGDHGSEFDLVLNQAGALADALSSALRSALDSDLDRDLDLDLDRAVDRAHDLTMALDVDPALAHDIASYLALAHALAHVIGLVDGSRSKRFQDVLVVFDWAGSIIYGLVAYAAFLAEDGTNPTVPMVQAGLSPVDDERAEFERVWSLVERAVDSGSLPPGLEDEIRALNKVLSITRNELDPNRHADVFDLVSTKLSALLPDILAALLPAGTPAPPSVELAAAGAEVDEQLEALDNDLDQAATTLEEIVEQITDEPDQTPVEVVAPVAYGDKTIDKLNQRFHRIDTTYAKLQTTRTGRFMVRNAGAAVLAGGSAVGLAATEVVSGGVASMIATLGSWLYTRIRRFRTDLPPRNRTTPDSNATPAFPVT